MFIPYIIVISTAKNKINTDLFYGTNCDVPLRRRAFSDYGGSMGYLPHFRQPFRCFSSLLVFIVTAWSAVGIAENDTAKSAPESPALAGLSGIFYLFVFDCRRLLRGVLAYFSIRSSPGFHIFRGFFCGSKIYQRQNSATPLLFVFSPASRPLGILYHREIGQRNPTIDLFQECLLNAVVNRDLPDGVSFRTDHVIGHVRPSGGG